MLDSLSNVRGSLSTALLILGALAVVVFLVCEFRITNHPVSNPIAQRYNDALRIGNALKRYQNDHAGQLPDRLSLLLPEYANITNLARLLRLPLSPSNFEASIMSEMLSSNIDNHGACIYLGARGISADVLLYDRPEFWPTNFRASGVTTLTANCLPRLRSVNDLQDKLKIIQKSTGQ